MRSSRALLAVAVVALASAPAAALAQAKACKAGTVFAGNPMFRVTGNERVNPSGAGLLEDPPLLWRTLTFVGKNLYTNTGQEVWVADLGAGKVRRVAGETQARGLPKFGAGPCALARFANIHGIAALTDGSLVVADNEANALLKIASPLDPAACTVSYLAGNNQPNPAVRDMPKGDKDGPAAEAKIGRPDWPVADGEGNVYFIDGNAVSVKKLAADEARTVSTIAPLPREGGIQTYRGMTMHKGKLYTVTNTLNVAFIHEIDPASGKVKATLTGDGKRFNEIGANMAAALSSIASDGKDLYVTGSGYIWRVTLAGKISLVAGSGNQLDFPPGYNPTGSYPPNKLILRYRVGDQGPMGTTTAMAFNEGSLYWRGRNDGAYVVKLDCR